MAPPHAGFAALFEISERRLQDLLRILYHSGLFRHAWSFDTALPGIRFDLFADVPEIHCCAKNGRAIEVCLRAWGVATSHEAVSFAKLDTTLTIRCVITLRDGVLALSIVPFSVDVSYLAITTGNDPAPTVFDEDGRQLFAMAIGTYLDNHPLSPSVNIGFLGPLAKARNVRLTPHMLDGVLAIGVDVDERGVVTNGNPDWIADTTGGADISLWVHPDVLLSLASDVTRQIEEKIRKKLQRNDATVSPISLSLEDGRLRVWGSVSMAGATAEFTASVVPRVGYGRHERYEEEDRTFEVNTESDTLGLSVTDVGVKVEYPWWKSALEVIAGVLTLGIAPLVLESYLDMLQLNAMNQVPRSQTLGERTHVFTLPHTDEPLLRMRVEKLEIHRTGIFAAMTLRPDPFRAADLQGPGYVAAADLPERVLQYRFRLPYEAHTDDPELRLRWIVTRTDTGAVLLWSDGLTVNRTSLEIPQPLRAALLDARGIRVAVRLYRTLGAAITDLANLDLRTDICDPLDRSHPFVKWSHEVKVPLVRVEDNGTHTLLGERVALRHSKIHRTDLRGRCRMATRYSPHAAGRLEWLDALPFPPADLPARRREVCDYCFFGGPTKSVPLI